MPSYINDANAVLLLPLNQSADHSCDGLSEVHTGLHSKVALVIVRSWGVATA